MAHRWTNDLTHDDVTPKALWLNRRQLIAGLTATGAAGVGGPAAAQDSLEPNTWEEITTYNNF
ncbi:MAG: twin-arginine translocation signal domain-containing protein, partial [Alphaproteobacteria bacterium]|nr:twin-arginine translocation signal domain-containing protein [Alphaproteobacteria bacterium]